MSESQRGPAEITSITPPDLVESFQAEMNIQNKEDAQTLLNAERRFTRRITAILANLPRSPVMKERLSASYEGPVRLRDVQDCVTLEFPLCSIPASRLKRFNKPKTLIVTFGNRLRVKEDLKIFREDCLLNILRIPTAMSIGAVGVSVLAELNSALSWSRYEMNEDSAPGELKENMEVDPGGASVTFEDDTELAVLFWEIERALSVRDGDTDLFVIRVMRDGHACLEKLCLDMETFSVWLYPIDTGRLPDLKPTSLKPIKVVVSGDSAVSAGYASSNFARYFDKIDIKQPVPTLDQCLVIRSKEECIALITPHYLVRNELLFILKMWLSIQQSRKKVLRALLGVEAAAPIPD